MCILDKTLNDVGPSTRSITQMINVVFCPLPLLYLGMINGGLKHKETYFVTVIAVNKVGLKTVAFSKPLVVDDTPPRVCTLTRHPRLKAVQLLNRST